jgi:hypothetical protein
LNARLYYYINGRPPTKRRKSMADEQKTRTIGTLAAADVRKLAGWKEYKEASDAYTAARQNPPSARTR